MMRGSTLFKRSRLQLACLCLAVTGVAYYWFTRPVLVETGITLEKAGQLKQGMSYEEVVDVLGCKPGVYNEFLKNTNPKNGAKGGQFTVEDADIESVLHKNEYEIADWSDFRDVKIKVIFTKDTRLVHKVYAYRYVSEENAFRFARPIQEAMFSALPAIEAITQDEAVKIAVAHLKGTISGHEGYDCKATMDEVTKEWTILVTLTLISPVDLLLGEG